MVRIGTQPFGITASSSLRRCFALPLRAFTVAVIILLATRVVWRSQQPSLAMRSQRFPRPADELPAIPRAVPNIAVLRRGWRSGRTPVPRPADEGVAIVAELAALRVTAAKGYRKRGSHVDSG